MKTETTKIFCRIEVYEGPEELLRSSYAREITTGGVVRFADGVKYGQAQVSWEDIVAVHPDGISNFVKLFDSLPRVELSERSDTTVGKVTGIGEGEE